MAKSSRRPYGSGEIRKVGKDKYIITATHGRKSDGKRRRKSKTVHGSKSDAERELLKLRMDLGAKPNLGDAMTLDQYYYGFFVSILKNARSNHTYRNYSGAYEKYIRPAFGDWPADQIDELDVQRWVLELPSASIARDAFKRLRAILRSMYKNHMLDTRPLDREIILPRHTEAPVAIWSRDEVAEALGRLKDHQLEALVLVMAGGGLRREEAFALDLPGDLTFDYVTDFATGKDHLVCRLVIKSSWVQGEEEKDETKTFTVRPVTIGEPFSSRLQEVIADGREKLLMSTRYKTPRPVQPSSVNSIWRKAFEPSQPLHGMKYVELRTLRHSHVTTSAQAGVNSSAIAAYHGHTEEVMRKHYLAFGAEDADKVAEAIRLEMAR